MHERPAVVDTDDDGTPVGEVRDAHVSADGERTRRRGERVLIESFAAGGSTPLELCAIPRRHADLNRSRRRRFVSKERATCRQQAHRSKGGQACAETSVDVSSRHHPQQRAPTGGRRSALSAGRWRSLNRRGSGVNGLRDPDSPPAAPFRTQRPGGRLTTRVPPRSRGTAPNSWARASGCGPGLSDSSDSRREIKPKSRADRITWTKASVAAVLTSHPCFRDGAARGPLGRLSTATT